MGESYLGDSVPVTGNIEKKGFAIASMVLGILSLLFVLLGMCLFFFEILAIMIGVLSLVLGIISIVKRQGTVMGIVGICCSVIAGLICIVLFTFFLVSVFLVGDDMMRFLIEFSKIYG